MKIKARKLYRIFVGSIFPLIYFFTPDKSIVLMFTFYLLGIMTVIEVLRRLSPKSYEVMVQYSKGVLKEHPGKIMGTTAYLVSVILVIGFFSKIIAIYALVFTVFGDAASTIIGKRFGKIRFWKEKSIAGTSGFFVITFLIGILLNFAPSLEIGWLKILETSAFSAFIEFLPIPMDDNLSVPILTAVFLFFIL